LESQAADFMNRGTAPLPAFLVGLIAAAANPDWRRDTCRDTSWLEVLRRIAEQLSKVNKDQSIPWNKLLVAFNLLVADGALFENSYLAAIAYAANDFRRAVELWDRAGSSETDEYRRAKAHIESFPANLRWFGSLKEHKQVLHEWYKRRADLPEFSKVDERVIAAVADSALAEGDLPLAAEMLDLRADRERAGKLLIAVLSGDQPQLISRIAVLAAKALVHTRDWKGAISRGGGKRFPGPGCPTSGQIALIFRDIKWSDRSLSRDRRRIRYLRSITWGDA
jgi:hypothetical protein